MEELKLEIKNSIGNMDCPKGFSCFNSGFENICKAEDIGLEKALLCMEEKSQTMRKCKYSISFGDVYFCHCSVRLYIAKRLKI